MLKRAWLDRRKVQALHKYDTCKNIVYTRKSNPFHGFFSGLTTVCSSLKHFAQKEFYSFSENNFHCYFYACGWNLPWNFPNLWAPLPICCLPLKIPSTWGSPSSGPGAVLDLFFYPQQGKPNFSLQLKPLSDPFSHFQVWMGLSKK